MPDRRSKHTGRNENEEISAALIKKIEPLLPVFTPSARGGRPRLSDEQALNGIFFVLRTGIAWCYSRANLTHHFH